MIGTLLRIGFINLRRDRVAQSLTFLMPIIFFSIFAMVFGNQKSGTRQVRVAVVDEDRSDYSKALVTALQKEGGLAVQTAAGKDAGGAPLDRAAAQQLVKAGTLGIALVLPKGLGATRQMWESGGTRTAAQLYEDPSDPVGPEVVRGLLEKVSFTAMPGTLAQDGIAMFRKYAGPLTPAQEGAVDGWMSSLQAPGADPAASGDAGNSAFGLPVETINVVHPGADNGSTVSFYAAGVGVMFLLFSCSAAGGALLDEEESGTLGRLLSSRAGMRGVLLGKWIFLTIVGILQLTVMFTWGAVMFKLPLLSHLPGFSIMTVFTAAAASALGLVLATASRSRAQLSGISTTLILTMSALGGSMFPRFLMSETMQKIGLVTFNAWALDGYLKVFWYERPLVELWSQLAVLSVLTVVFLAVARVFARRWETL
jgi:ABC-2 type transport system permease protein